MKQKDVALANFDFEGFTEMSIKLLKIRVERGSLLLPRMKLIRRYSPIGKLSKSKMNKLSVLSRAFAFRRTRCSPPTGFFLKNPNG